MFAVSGLMYKCKFKNGIKIYNILWRAVYAPGDGQTSPAYSSQSVQCLYINHLLSVNKQVVVPLGAGILLRCVEAAATEGLWPPPSIP